MSARCGRGYALRILSLNAAAALLVALVFTGVTWQTPWQKLVESYGVCFLFSNCIGTLIAVTMPRIAPIVRARVGFPLDWAIYIAWMMLLAGVGSVLAIGILTAIGYVPSSQFMRLLSGSLKISVIMSLTFGIFGTAFEMIRGRLDAAVLALRTKERDEATIRHLTAETQLASLESRVQPHFLFNTLNSIAALIPIDPAGAERMTGQLASLLRSSLDAEGSRLVPLSDEIRVVRDYLEIERVRFGDRLRFDIDVDERVAGLSVPRLSVQTLVENSIKYAVSPKRDGAHVVIRASADDGRAFVEIADDGPGFDPASVQNGHGLALLRSRLGIIYGSRATLNISSRPGRTAVTIDLPLESVPA